MKHNPDLHYLDNAVRVGFCADNTPEDVDALLTHLEHGLKTLK